MMERIIYDVAGSLGLSLLGLVGYYLKGIKTSLDKLTAGLFDFKEYVAKEYVTKEDFQSTRTDCRNEIHERLLALERRGIK